MTTTAVLSAEEIAELLDEPNVGLVAEVLAALGAERTEALVDATLRLEAAGGIATILDPQRRRTPGGAFFWLVKHTTPFDLRQKLFPDAMPSGQRHPPSWAEVIASIASLMHPTPEEATVKLTLVGRPATWQVNGSVVCFRLVGKLPHTLPRGMPALPKTPPITWTVIVALRQWTKIKDAFLGDPADKLIVDGYPYLDGDEHIVLANACRSMAMDRQQKELQRLGEAQADPRMVGT
jgi:hypothetical protein